jgi:S1-C subfamily serine protease
LAAGSRITAAVCLLALVLCAGGPAQAGGALSRIEKEFERAIDRVSPATVVCVPAGVDESKALRINATSGVLIDRKGWVLSDSAAGTWFSGKRPTRRGEKVPPPTLIESEDVEIRLPDLKGRGFQEYAGKVIIRNKDLDTSLIRLTKAPPGGFPYLSMADSDELRVGQFAFAMGNSFGLANEAPPTLTAGLISALVPAKDEAASGKYDTIYTSAAVNPGVNGGPLADALGRLVGTISGPVPPWDREGNAGEPYQFLGRVVPLQRLIAFYARVPEAKGLFDDARRSRTRAPNAAALETVFNHVAQETRRSLVGIEVKRKTPFKELHIATPRGLAKLPRYDGPVSGILVSREGHVLTSLYNLTNVFLLVNPINRKNIPAEMKVQTWLDQIESITVHLPSGERQPAKLLGRHEGLGLALLQMGARMRPAPTTPTPAAPAPKEADPKDPASADSEGKEPEGKEPEGKDPEGKDPEGKDPEGKDPKAEDPAAGEPGTQGPPEKSPAASEPDAEEPAPPEPDPPARTFDVDLLEPVAKDFYETGRLLLAVARPFGENGPPDPLVAFGVLSKFHGKTSPVRWAGHWQTDASLTDATCGGAAVDLEGRLIGMLQLWSPGSHGRNSGIGFIVPWSEVEAVMEDLKAGRVFQQPFLGVVWAPDQGGGLKLGEVVKGSAAESAGLKVGDVIKAIDGAPIESIDSARKALQGRWSGDKLTVTIIRGQEQLDIAVTLGARS